MTICCCSCRGRWPHPLLLFILAVLSLTVGIVIICETPRAVTAFVNSQLELTTPGSSLFSPFQNPSAPMQGPKMNLKISIYGFHCPNSNDVIAKGVPPKVEQIGPYVYNVSRYKHPMSWEDDDKHITYRYHTVFNFDPTSSIEKNDNITQYTFINPGIGGALIRLQDPKYSSALPTVNNWITNTNGANTPNDGLFTNRSIMEITFGYLSPVLLNAQELRRIFGPSYLPEVPTVYPAVIVNDTTLTTTADTTQLTGKENIQDILKVVKWAGYDSLPWWGEGRPQKFQGGDGTQFPPEMSVGDVHSAFLDILGRDVDLKVDEATTANDIPIKILKIDPNSLKSAKENPENKGYYQFGPSGVWNLTAFPLSPVYNAPIYVSKPFFLDADASYRQKVLFSSQPNPDIHDMKIEAVEHLGVPLRANIRFQVNSRLWKVPGLDVTANLTDSLIPVVWVDLAEEPTQDMIDYLKSKLSMRRAGLVVGYVVGAFLVLLSVVLVLVGVVSYVRRSRRSEGQRLLEVVDEQGKKKGHYVNI